MASVAHTASRLREEAKGASARGVIREVLRGYEKNDLLTYGSAIAFQILFALIPLTLFALGVLGFLGLEDVYRNDIAPELKASTSSAAFSVIDSTVHRVLDSKQGFWITTGAVICVWEMSGAVRAIMGVFDRIYDVAYERSFAERYVVSIVLAIGTGLLLLGAVAVMQVGHVAGGLWVVVRWPVAAVLLYAVVALLVRHAPGTRNPVVHHVTMGSVIIVVAWLGTSAVFGFYVTQIADYSTIFGNLATVIIVFEYLYLAACAFLTGALLDARMRDCVGEEPEPD